MVYSLGMVNNGKFFNPTILNAGNVICLFVRVFVDCIIEETVLRKINTLDGTVRLQGNIWTRQTETITGFTKYRAKFMH